MEIKKSKQAYGSSSKVLVSLRKWINITTSISSSHGGTGGGGGGGVGGGGGGGRSS